MISIQRYLNQIFRDMWKAFVDLWLYSFQNFFSSLIDIFTRVYVETYCKKDKISVSIDMSHREISLKLSTENFFKFFFLFFVLISFDSNGIVNRYS